MATVLACTALGVAAAAAPVGAVTGGASVPLDVVKSMARVDVGEVGRGARCTGVLVHKLWVLTARSCFGQSVSAGPPAQATTVTIHKGWSTRDGEAQPEPTVPPRGDDPEPYDPETVERIPVRWLVPHADRNLVLAQLDVRSQFGVPARVGGAPAAQGEELTIAGFGRTETTWPAGSAPKAVTASVTAVGPASFDIVGTGGATTCKGDAGGPAMRQTADGFELVGVHHTSWQKGCLGSTETRDGAVETRADDLAEWIAAETRVRCNAQGIAHGSHQQGAVVPLFDYTGDCRADIMRQDAAGELKGWPGTGDLSDRGRLFAGSPVLTGTGWTVSSVPRVVIGDVNGDGRADIQSQNTLGQLRAWRSTGDMSADATLFVGPARLNENGLTTSAMPRMMTGDFNGDGRTDLLGAFADGTLRAWPSSGDLSADGALYGDPVTVGTGWSSSGVTRVILGDFTGDGRTDIIAQKPNGDLRAWAATGDMSADARLFTGPGALVAVGGWTTSDVPRIVPGDFDGDGITDLIAQRADGTLRAFRSTGDMSPVAQRLFTVSVLVGTSWTVQLRPRILVGDLNGDGRTDIISQSTNGDLRAWAATGDLSADARLFPGPGVLVGTSWTTTALPRIL